MFRKEEKALQEWSADNVTMCSGRQKRILADILPALKPNGFLIYSTCTYNRTENEENVKWLTKQGLECVKIEIPLPQKGSEIIEVEENDVIAYRFFPHKTKGKGFFLTCMQKKAGKPIQKHRIHKKTAFENLHKKQLPIVKKWIKDDVFQEMEYFIWKENILGVHTRVLEDVLYLANRLYIKNLGTELGQIKGQDFIPSHQLAMSHLSHLDIQKHSLSHSQALQYLRKEDFELSEQVPNGWTIFEYERQHLGWAKVLPNRLNNYYPSELRVRMQ
jgi:NOL1/NOP2/fmu family ribosome biogenesis protein